jgi:S1-C subfamily serine protease
LSLSHSLILRLFLAFVLLLVAPSVAIPQNNKKMRRNKQAEPQLPKSAIEKGPIKTMTVAGAVESLRPSVVQIAVYVYEPDDPGAPARLPGTPPMKRPLETALLGTGFLVSDQGYVITAGHVVDALNQWSPQLVRRLMVGLAGPNMDLPKLQMVGSFDMYEGEIVERDSSHDLALLKLTRNPFTRPGVFATVNSKDISYNYTVAALVSERPVEGAQIVVSGYPLQSSVLVTNAGWLASSWLVNVNRSPVPNVNQGARPSSEDVYLADVAVNKGNSGGPVFSIEDKGVIGVCVAHVSASVFYGDGARESVTLNNRPLVVNAGIAFVVPAKYVIELMKRHSIAPKSSKQNSRIP